VCAETDEEAARLAGPMDVVKAGLLQGRSETAFPTPEEAAAHAFTEQEEKALTAFRSQQAHGSPASVVKRLAEVVEATGADELMLVTPVYSLADRLRSYELVKEYARA
jgi:alkanesulfonate monooxygenase SsuD/methylene tetrahydromethanopterin reductase-like flavin-dependent oxidoreductase (luciferase family)